MKNEKYNIYFFLVLIYLLIFQNWIQIIIPIFKYFDEFLAMLFIPIFLYKIRQGNVLLKKRNLIIFICFIIISVVGIYSNLIYDYQNIKYVLIDWLLLIKFPLVYFSSLLLFDIDLIKDNKDIILKNVKIIVVLFSLLSIGNYLFDWFDGPIRFGFKTNQLFYEHSTYLVAACVNLFSLLILCEEKNILKYSLFLLLITVSTLRFKAIGIVVVVTIVCFYINKTNKKLELSKIFFISLVLLALSFKQVSYYFFEGETARQQLLTHSFIVAKDYFPIGTGFATYGSYYSTQNYSPIYYIYGLNNAYGIAKNDPAFISDCFWPMIIGQFGYIGLTCYIVVIIMLYLNISKIDILKNKGLYTSKIICILYLLISSVAESAFVNPFAIPLAIIIGVNEGQERID